MEIREPHPWDVTVEQAVAIQAQMASRIARSNLLTHAPRQVVGTDVSPAGPTGQAAAAAVVVRLSDNVVVETAVEAGKFRLDYIPGLLAFREAPLVIAALRQLQSVPDLILTDGHGMAHPRRFGLACHVGLLANTPSVGCAKSMLVGKTCAPGGRKGIGRQSRKAVRH